jgi:hypothetical protein
MPGGRLHQQLRLSRESRESQRSAPLALGLRTCSPAALAGAATRMPPVQAAYSCQEELMSRWPTLFLAAAVFASPFIVGCDSDDHDRGDHDRVSRDDSRVHDRDWHDQHTDRGYYDRY